MTSSLLLLCGRGSLRAAATMMERRRQARRVDRGLGGAMAEQVELAQVIGQLRQELSAAMREGEGEDLRFELGPVELELTIAVSKEAGPNAKVRFWVVELGADAKVASQATQRITLTLDPRRRGIAGRPEISGSEQAGER
jgi:hypothetical protein